MPRLRIQEQRTVARGARTTADAFGAAEGRALVGAGAAVAAAGQKLEQHYMRDQALKLNKDMTDAALAWADKERQYAEENPTGEGMVEQFDQDWAEFSSSIMEKYNDTEQAQRALNDMYGRTRARVMNKQADTKVRYQVATYESDRDRVVAEVESGNMDGATAIGLLTDGANALGAVNPTARGALLQENEDLIGGAEIGHILETEGFIAADEAVKSDEYGVMSSAARAAARRKISSAAGAHVRKKRQDTADRFRAGYITGDLSRDIAIAEQFNLDDEAEELRVMQRVSEEVNAIVIGPSVDAVKYLRELDSTLRAGAGDSEDLTMAQTLGAALDHKNRMLKEDPYTWIEQTGWFDGQQAGTLDLQGDMSEGLDVRRAMQEEMLKVESRKIPLFRPEEVSALQNTLATTAPEQRVMVLANVSSQLVGTELVDAATQVAKKDATLAVAMNSSIYDPELTRDILVGRDRDVVMPPENDLKAAFMRHTERAIDDPVAQQHAIEAATALYKQAMFNNKTADSSVLDTDIWEESIDRVIGEPVEVGSGFLQSGNKTLSFRTQSGEYLPADDFSDLVEDLTVEDFQATHGDTPRDITGRELELGRAFEQMQLVAIGDATYTLRNDRGQYAMDSEGGVFEINMRALHERRVSGL